jgi:hypothetical protein
MDPITLIVAALAAGTSSAVQDSVSETVKDAYGALKRLILRKFGSRPEVAVTLDRAAQNPEVWTAPLAEVLREAGADRDEDVVRAARELMALVQPADPAVKYALHIVGDVQGLAAGDHQHVEMRFGPDA